jgi:hypothetical protein
MKSKLKGIFSGPFNGLAIPSHAAMAIALAIAACDSNCAAGKPSPKNEKPAPRARFKA